MTEITLVDYEQKNITMGYDWVSAFMGNNPFFKIFANQKYAGYFFIFFCKNT